MQNKKGNKNLGEGDFKKWQGKLRFYKAEVNVNYCEFNINSTMLNNFKNTRKCERISRHRKNLSLKTIFNIERERGGREQIIKGHKKTS